MANGYFGGANLLRNSSRSSILLLDHVRRLSAQVRRSMGLCLSGAAPRPSAESMSTERTAGVSQLQLRKRLVPLRHCRFQLLGKSAWPVELSTGIEVMKYFVRFIGSSRPGPQLGQPGR